VEYQKLNGGGRRIEKAIISEISDYYASSLTHGKGKPKLKINMSRKDLSLGREKRGGGMAEGANNEMLVAGRKFLGSTRVQGRGLRSFMIQSKCKRKENKTESFREHGQVLVRQLGGGSLFEKEERKFKAFSMTVTGERKSGAVRSPYAIRNGKKKNRVSWVNWSQSFAAACQGKGKGSRSLQQIGDIEVWEDGKSGEIVLHKIDLVMGEREQSMRTADFRGERRLGGKGGRERARGV